MLQGRVNTFFCQTRHIFSKRNRTILTLPLPPSFSSLAAITTCTSPIVLHHHRHQQSNPCLPSFRQHHNNHHLTYSAPSPPTHPSFLCLILLFSPLPWGAFTHVAIKNDVWHRERTACTRVTESLWYTSGKGEMPDETKDKGWLVTRCGNNSGSIVFLVPRHLTVLFQI